MKKILKRLFGTQNERFMASLQPTVDQINGLEDSIKPLSDDELKAKTDEFRKRLSKGESLDDILPEAFACVREAARRALGERHYDVQLMGGIILHRNMVAEMKTGEGKTLVSTLAAYLNAIPGKGVHIVTVNDYLASRDAEWMGRVFSKLGLTTGSIVAGLTDEERKAAYACDITYATNNELGFDYLRDNMKFSAEHLVQRPLNYAIIDEVDSILIDEARTPLVISGPTEDRTELYMAVDKIIPKLDANVDWVQDEKMRQVTLTEEGMDRAEELLKKSGIVEEDSALYDIKNVSIVHHINQALKAHVLFKRDKDYIVKDDQVMIIDEFTGRMMKGRRFSEGLHQALEAKEGVSVQSENQTLASITFQNFFRMYNKISGMTGTADTEAEELGSIYGLKVVVVPTNVPVQRIDDADRIYRTLAEKDDAIIADIKDCVERGQPVLVGTSSIEKSEQLSEVLKKAKIPHNVLNARYHEHEAEIIAQAGRKGAITIATNMAGRGTDIKLGGNLELLLAEADKNTDEAAVKKAYEAEKKAVMDAGGLRVLGTERHESRRIDNQLRGRSGRQGDVGSSVFYLSLQDDLMRIFAPNMDQMMAKLNMQEGEVIQSRLVSAAIEAAQRKIEARNFDIRKNLLKFDDVLNNQRKVIYGQRHDIMEEDSIEEVIAEFREDVVDGILDKSIPPKTLPEEWNIDSMSEEALRVFGVRPPFAQWFKEDSMDEDILRERLLDYLENVYAEKEKRFGTDMLRRAEKGLLLQVMDQQWKDHLQRLDYLREGVGLRGFAQRDPLNEYKQEAFTMFEAMLDYVREETVQFLYHAEMAEKDVRNLPGGKDFEEPEEAKGGGDNETDPFASQNIGRNQPCPCGSGKKYKHCHGALAASA